ncbi:MAG: hypothetical protein ABJI96_10720 [Paracoccaceae bacterium]
MEALNESMQWHMHYVGRDGLLSFAISAIDIALWDLQCKALAQPLHKVAGGADNTCRAYGGCIDLAFSLPKLLYNIQGYLDAVKINIREPMLD